MKALFVTMVWPPKGSDNMYSDLVSEFTGRGESVDVVALSEKRNQIETHIDEEENLQVLYVKCGNIQKVNKYSKVLNSFGAGISLVFAVKKYLKGRKYDTIIFALPPLTIAPAVIHIKKYFHTKLYLLLKEFWPQDPTDLGAMRKGGAVWKAFRYLEKMLYKNSDYIGTMSEAGITFIKENNPNVTAELEVCPNSQKAIFLNVENKAEIRKRYGLPEDKCIFVFGGNFGISQGIPEMIAEIKAASEIEEAFFLLIGNGTEFHYAESELKSLGEDKLKILSYMPRKEFDQVLCACDVGMIFLYPKYTVPNIPSRMISYLLARLPILAAVDSATDAGDIVERAGCGIKVLNGDVYAFKAAVQKLIDSDIRVRMRRESEHLMVEKYTTEQCYRTIVRHFNNKVSRQTC